MSDTIICSAELTVELPAAEAMRLFTAEGERRWAGDAWDPRYPAPARTEGPGAVFVTAHDHQTTWIMVDQDATGVRYARVTPDVAAGTVAVTVIGAQATRTRVRVTYDLTALGDAGRVWLAAFAAGYDAEIADWEAAIATRGI
jgi:hypothetical protein